MEASKDSPSYQRSAAEIAELIESGARLIDVRAEHEFDAGHLAGAERIGLEVLADRRDELEPGAPVVFYCLGGKRSAMAAEAFADSGLEVHSLDGGINAWVDQGHEIEPADGYVSEPGEAAAILDAKARSAEK